MASILLAAAIGLLSTGLVSTLAVAQDAGDRSETNSDSGETSQRSADAGADPQRDRQTRDAGPPARPESQADESDADRILVDYTGQLEDESGAPISGIFHFSFNLYSDSKSAEPLWSETLYVSVVDGRYTVPLGQTSALQREHIAGTRWIGVELVGEGEILRDKLSVQSGAAREKDEGDEALSEKTRRFLDEAAENSDMTFAEVAKRAVFADRAERAKLAEQVGSLSAEEIKRLSNLAMERLGEHIADPDAHGATGRSLGDQTRVMKQVGGPGGSTYRSECPPGFVVTGIKGGAGDMLDSIAIICRRLQ